MYPVSDDDYYRRKFNIKPFSIVLEKVSEDNVNDHKEEYKVTHRNVNISPSSALPEQTETSECKRVGYCNCGCGGIDEDYYKELFDIQDCQISLSRVSVDESSGSRLKMVFEYMSLRFLIKVCFTVVLAMFVFHCFLR